MVEFCETRIENLEKSIPPSVPSRNNRKSKKGSKKRKSVTFGESKVVLPVPWYVRTNYGRVYSFKSKSQTCKTEKRKIFQEKEKVYQTWGKYPTKLSQWTRKNQPWQNSRLFFNEIKFWKKRKISCLYDQLYNENVIRITIPIEGKCKISLDWDAFLKWQIN